MSDVSELLVRARDHVERMDFAKAVEVYSQAIRIDPHCQHAFEERAEAYDFLNKRDLAAADRKTAHKIDNEDRLKHLKEERPDYRAEAIFAGIVAVAAVLMFIVMG